MAKARNPSRIKAAGFTLVELAAAVFIIGVIAVIIARALSPSQDGARAQALFEASRKMGDVVSIAAFTCGVATVTSGSVLPDSAASKTMLDVLRDGNVSVAAAYQKCHRQAGIVPLTAVLQAGNKVQGFPVTLTGGGINALSVAYSGVPSAVVEQLVVKYGSGVFTPATADAANASVQYSAIAADGTHTLTVFVRV